MGKWPTRLAAVLSVLCATAFVALAAVGGWLFWDRVETRGAQQARAELAPLAAEQVPKVFGYDYQTVERSLTEAYTLLAPDFRQEFRDRATKDIIPQARERQVVSQAHVVGVGVLDAQRNSAQVMVYLNRTVTEKDGKPIYDGSRLRVDYTKVDGKWLIDYITPI
ncbi:mammalian cell entry protein [Mycolicibacterium litorale]|uniref:Mce associated protein n=1 Tax=Mycolicibacterium litorale TaxID=758802 RepID=A0AAD1MUF7_9MYCO|nr:mammalian cell entry protein [Mycolicibacterium litorale]MCV7418180.1 mammalian cell entry protein [Mycolicibacterium litorale]TDY06430.1 Mce-associated membrane protein [Mycolicibacterium litorale]BBY19424.1 Mce associated protein [Mycolicibacterium litorale]